MVFALAGPSRAHSSIAAFGRKSASVTVSRTCRSEMPEQLRNEVWLPDAAECTRVRPFLQNAISPGNSLDPLDCDADVPLRWIVEALGAGLLDQRQFR